MSYTKNTWKSGDTVTSAKLNNMEEGIASSGAFMVHGTLSEDTGAITLDKTWREIYDAAQEKYVGIIVNDAEGVMNCPLLGTMYVDPVFFVSALFLTGSSATIDFVTDSEDGYPTYAGDK